MERGKLAVFAGTSEGRALCEHLAAQGLAATVRVATEYGRALLPALPGLTVQAGRLDAAGMEALLRQGYTRVVDATHPYASEASANLRQAAQAAGVEYLRLIRPAGEHGERVVTLPDTQAAVDYLRATSGPVLLTTGSKELAAYAGLADFQERVYARVLPDPAVLEHCRALGLPASHLIAMQGPFSRELNLALLRSLGARYLVTKDTGAAGGLEAKLAAAAQAGATVLLIARPTQEQGHSLEELAQLLTGCPLNAAPAAVPSAQTPGRFPLFIDLQGQPCLVVGGGTVATRRIRVLQSFGAAVRAVAPSFQEQLPGVDYHQRPYQEGDIVGMTLVVAATDRRELNRQVGVACRAAGIPVSVADSAEECSFFFPAVCRSAQLSVGLVSTGAAHQKTAESAAAIRRLLEEIDP